MAESVGILSEESYLYFDEELQDFFKKIILEKGDKVAERRKHITDALSVVDTGKCPAGAKSCFDDSLHRITYIFRYSTCYTSAIAKHFLNLVEANSDIFKDAVDRRRVNICCLGGGPGTEVVAISRVFSLTEDYFKQNNEKSLRLKVTIIDKALKWKETACKVLQTLTNSPEMFDQTKMVIRLRFLEADLKEPLTEDVKKAIQEADLVTMVVFLSALGKKFSNDVPKLTKDIVKCMKPCGVLFYLDTGKNQQRYDVSNALDTLGYVSCVYGPVELEVFTLSEDSLMRNIEIFHKPFYGNSFLPGALINTCAWLKNECTDKCTSISTNKRLASQRAKQWKMQWEEKALQSERKLQTYLRNVELILKCEKYIEKLLRERSSVPNFRHPSPEKCLMFANKTKNRQFFVSTAI